MLGLESEDDRAERLEVRSNWKELVINSLEDVFASLIEARFELLNGVGELISLLVFILDADHEVSVAEDFVPDDRVVIGKDLDLLPESGLLLVLHDLVIGGSHNGDKQVEECNLHEESRSEEEEPGKDAHR